MPKRKFLNLKIKSLKFAVVLMIIVMIVSGLRFTNQIQHKLIKCTHVINNANANPKVDRIL